MTISLATNKDIESLFYIWKICFSSDTIFLNLFFKECFPLTQTYVYKDGDIVVSSITLIPITLVNNTPSKGVYLYGVCTLPQYRGNHLSIRLLEYAEENCKDSGYNYIITRPGAPSLFALYRKIGFCMPIYRQIATFPLPIFAESVTYSNLTAERFKELRYKYLQELFFEWKIPMLRYILSYTAFIKGIAVELESDRYMIGYPDEEDNETYHILELGSYSSTIKYPSLYLASNLIKARHLERTKVKLYLPISKHYSDLDSTEKEVFVLLKPLTSMKIDNQSFFNYSLE